MRTDFSSFCHLALLASLARRAYSYTITKDQECLSALVGIYGDLTFVGVGSGAYYDTVCENPLAVASIHAAAKIYCSPREIEHGLPLLHSSCKSYSTNGTWLPESAVAVNLTDEAIRNMRYLGLSDLTEAGNLTEPVLVTEEVFSLAYRTEDDWDASLAARQNYGYAMYGFWGGLLLIGMIQRLATWLLEGRKASTSNDVEENARRRRDAGPISEGLKRLAAPYYWIRTYIVTPSVLPPYRRELLYGCTVPTRLEFLVVLACWALNIVLCAVNFRGFEGNFYWPKVSTQTWRYVADRTGVISYANIPILWMFSGRNNIFIWATGWSFSTFNTFHKHVARIATLEAIIHSIGYTGFYRSYSGSWKGYISEYEEEWFYLGVAATVAMSFLVLFSFSIFRSKTYEIFLIVHIVLAIVLIFFLFRHTSIFDGQYDPYLWSPVAIWSFDRFLRLVRLVYCNIHVSIRKGTSIHYAQATVIYDIEADRISIDVIPATSSLKPGPGQHYYLYQPFTLTGWENHPLTLASWKHDDPDEAAPTSGTGSRSHTKRLTLSFWLRPCDGWTRKLKNQCLKSPDATVNTTILIEGPYGRAEPLWEFDEVLLVAGGSGISAALPYLRDHMDRLDNPKRPNRTTSITLLWADRSEAYIRKQAAGDLAGALSRQDITMSFYSTSTSASHSDTSQLTRASEKTIELTEAIVSKELGLFSPSQSPTPGQIIVHHGRPDLMSVIEKTARTARESETRLAIYVCGPPGLADATRDAAYRVMKQYREGVEYFEEAFGW